MRFGRRCCVVRGVWCVACVLFFGGVCCVLGLGCWVLFCCVLCAVCCVWCVVLCAVCFVMCGVSRVLGLGLCFVCRRVCWDRRM